MDLPPALPAASDRLDIAGFALGHGTDRHGHTGVTVLLAPPEGAAAAAEVRGSATGTRQFDSLVSPHHLASRAHAVVLAGGSAFGLSAADRVAARLAGEGRGLATGYGPVPLVPTAILFDLGFGDPAARPGPELVDAALAAAATGPVAMGSVGAGAGATVGKCRGPQCAMKGGFGFASLTTGQGLTVAAAVAVNAYGDVVDPATDRVVAGCGATAASHRLVDARRVLAALPADARHPWEQAAAGERAAASEAGDEIGNTALAVVLTDADLPKAALLKVCQMAFGGLYRTLAPALTLYDGDLVVALAAGRRAAHPHAVGVLAERAVSQAILRAVEHADGSGLLPAWRDLR